MGTPDFALESLKALYEAKYDIIGVVTNIDKPKGRGMKMVASPVKEYAIEKNLQVYQPVKVRNNPEFLEAVKKLNPDLICVVALCICISMGRGLRCIFCWTSLW